MPTVMVVPETEGFEFDVSHENLVWVTKKLGKPQLARREVRYLAPLWLKGGVGVTRVYHILSSRDAGEATEFELGNSFVLKSTWNKSGQRRRFEYHDLSAFGFAEISPGLLLAIP
jgi:hypothetical protein